jgi:hypothetical protein
MFKAKLLCIGWSNKRLDNVKMHSTTVETMKNKRPYITFLLTIHDSMKSQISVTG